MNFATGTYAVMCHGLSIQHYRNYYAVYGSFSKTSPIPWPFPCLYSYPCRFRIHVHFRIQTISVSLLISVTVSVSMFVSISVLSTQKYEYLSQTCQLSCRFPSSCKVVRNLKGLSRERGWVKPAKNLGASFFRRDFISDTAFSQTHLAG